MLLIDDSSTILYDNTSFLEESDNEASELDINSVPTIPIGQPIDFTPDQIPNVEVLALATSDQITIQGSPIIYVRQGSGGSGTSWADAYGDLQTAINNAPAGSEIWVAAGVYLPSGTGDRAASFTLKDQLEVYGGFGGFETERGQRNIGANITYLSGDIGALNDNSDNSYHVVSVQNIANYAVLDGFTITGGNANQRDNDDGGGIFSRSGRAAFSNLVITGNRADDRGGGIYTNSTVDLFTNVVIVANQAGQGGAIFTDDNTSTDDGIDSQVTFINSTFSQNSSSSIGGAIRAFRTDLTIFGSVFDRNASATDGGAIIFSASDVNVTNSTFSNNTAQNDGGGINVIAGALTVTNSIFWGNQALTNSQIRTDRPERISNSLVQGGLAGGVSILDADPLFVDAASGNLSLQAGSPAINIGNNASVPATVSNDLAGFPRISDGVVDLGAYEFFAFDPASYGASNPDLISVYRDDLTGLTNHYLQYGRFEGRSTDNFDELRYTASSYVNGGDLIGAFGLNGGAATLHYLTNGFFEGRSTTAFVPSRYLNSWDDLLGAFGTNTAAGTQHYISSGFSPEGRDPNRFLSDHYLASHGDLINAFAPITDYAAKIETASNHYLFNGRGEGRQVTFDPNAYLNANPDLIPFAQAGQLDPTQHYILSGFNEGRAVA